MITLPPMRRLLLAVVLFGLAAGFVVGHLAWDIPAGLLGLVVLADLVRGLRRGVLGVDIIALLAIVGAIALGQHLAAVIIALMVAGGSALEEFAAARARRELASLLGRTPRVAHRHAADRVIDVPVDAALNALLLPHQTAEERAVFPELAQRLGGRDPLGAMTHMHDEIAHLSTRFTALVKGLSDKGVSNAEVREVRRLLYALDAIIALHLAAEEELLSNVEDLPVHAA